MSGRIARMLGRQEARQESAMVTGPGFAPRLSVRYIAGTWCWDVWEGCRWHDGAIASSQPEALAVGLAALETASVRTTR